MLLDDALDDGQPESDAAVPPAEEWLEEARQILRCNAAPAVGYPDLHPHRIPFLHCRGIHGDQPVGRRVADRVVDQVLEHLHHAAGVEAETGKVLRQFQRDLYAAGLGPRRTLFGAAADQLDLQPPGRCTEGESGRGGDRETNRLPCNFSLSPPLPFSPSIPHLPLHLGPRRLAAEARRAEQDSQRAAALGSELEAAEVANVELIPLGPHRRHAAAAQRLVQRPQRIGLAGRPHQKHPRQIDHQVLVINRHHHAASAFDERGSGRTINGPRDNTAGGAGALYVFTRQGGVWSQEAYIKGSRTEATDQLGYVVAISDDGNTIAAGAGDEDCLTPGVNPPGCDNDSPPRGTANIWVGAAYVFVRTGSSWTERGKLKASDGAADEYFGRAVALSNGTVIVGAPADDDAGGVNAGSAYAYSLPDATWTDLGFGLAGVAGVPELAGTGTLVAGSAGALELVNAAPSAPALLFVSFTSTPMKAPVTPGNAFAASNLMPLIFACA